MNNSISPVVFRNDMVVREVDFMGSDESIVRAARVSTGTNDKERSVEDDHGLIRYLMRNRHGSVFEHVTGTFYVEAPIFVFREFMRHRIASYNETSARYRELNPEFYVPPAHRNLVQTGKVGHYIFEPGTKEQHDLTVNATKSACVAAWVSYQEMLRAGVAKEVARGVLPVATYSSMYVTMNARGAMNFLSLRVPSETSHPQWEIAQVAQQLEELWSARLPITLQAFRDAGRVTP